MFVLPKATSSSSASTLIAPAISLDRPEKKDLRKGQYLECKCHTRPGDPDSPVYSIQIPYFGTGTPEEWLQFLDGLEKAIRGQNISSGPERYELTERLLTGDALTTFKLKALEAGTRTVEHYSTAMDQLTAHIFPAHSYREQKRYMRRFLKKPRGYSVREFASRLQEMNQYLRLFPSETEHPAVPLPEDELKEVLFHAMPGTWRQEMTKQGFNYPNHTVIDLIQFAERLEPLEPKDQDKKAAAPKGALKMDTIPKKKRKHVSFDQKNKKSNKKTGMQFCRLCGLNPDHHTGNCDELGPLLYKEKKRRAEAGKKNPYYRFNNNKDYVHKQEINSMVNEQVKKILKKQKKKKKKHEINAIDEFASLSVSEDSSNNDSSSDDTNIHMDSSDDA